MACSKRKPQMSEFQITAKRLAQLFKHTAIGAKRLGFYSRGDQIKYSVVHDLPPLRRFFAAMFPRR